jgi:hypothetical protein
LPGRGGRRGGAGSEMSMVKFDYSHNMVEGMREQSIFTASAEFRE